VLLHSRLKELAEAAHQSRCPSQLLQRKLLDELEEVEEVAALTADELVAELRDMQLAVLYGGEAATGDEEHSGSSSVTGRPHKSCKAGNEQLEQFLVDQVRQIELRGIALSSDHALVIYRGKNK
jgi:hypothetical protein